MKPNPRRQRPQGRPTRPSGPPVELLIEAVGGEGDGMALGPAFVPFLPRLDRALQFPPDGFDGLL